MTITPTFNFLSRKIHDLQKKKKKKNLDHWQKNLTPTVCTQRVSGGRSKLFLEEWKNLGSFCKATELQEVTDKKKPNSKVIYKDFKKLFVPRENRISPVLSSEGWVPLCNLKDILSWLKEPFQVVLNSTSVSKEGSYLQSNRNSPKSERVENAHLFGEFHFEVILNSTSVSENVITSIPKIPEAHTHTHTHTHTHIYIYIYIYCGG